MHRYAIRENGKKKTVGILTYEEKTKTYTIEIPEDVTEQEAPFLFALFLRKGIRRLDNEWSMRWVQSRIIPGSRQNISEILKTNGWDSYEEQELLLKNQGRSCQDEFYIEPLLPKFFVHYGAEHFDRNCFTPVRNSKNDKNHKKLVGGLCGYPVDPKYREEKNCFFFRLASPCNQAVISSREEWEKYPKQPQATVSGHAVLDYQRIARQGLGDGIPIYAIVTQFADRQAFRECFWEDNGDPVLVLNDAILIENYDAKYTENPLTLEDLLPLRHFKTLGKDIEVSCPLRSPDGKRYVYVEEPSTHYGFKTLVGCLSDERIVEVCGYTEQEAKDLMAKIKKA